MAWSLHHHSPIRWSELQDPGRGQGKIYHANLLKCYHPREKAIVVATVVTEEGELQDTTANAIPSFPLTPTETFKDVMLDGVLPVTQREEALAILAKHQYVLTERPGRTSKQEFSLKLLNDNQCTVAHTHYLLPNEK